MALIDETAWRDNREQDWIALFIFIYLSIYWENVHSVWWCMYKVCVYEEGLTVWLNTEKWG